MLIQTPDTISERARAPQCRMRDHFLWPFYRDEAGFGDAEGDRLIYEPGEAPLRKGVDLVWPTGHVYEFGNEIVFYSRSGLVSVQGILYAVFYEHDHLLSSYAWCSDQNITLASLECTWWARGRHAILRIKGVHVHRFTGEIVKWVRESGESYPSGHAVAYKGFLQQGKRPEIGQDGPKASAMDEV